MRTRPRLLRVVLLLAVLPSTAPRAAVLAPELPTSVVAYSHPSGGTDFLRVRGICLLPNGDLAVADEQAQDVVVMSPRGAFRFSFGTVGTAPGQFQNPAAVAATATGEMIVADRDNSRLQRFSSTGTLLQVIGGPGTGAGQFQRPSGVATAPNGDIFVSDQENHRVVHLAPDGTFIAQWGSLGTAIGQFQYPSQVAVDRHGDVYVTDLYNDRVQKFTGRGTFIRAWGTTGSGNGMFNFPAGIAVDELENVFVGETGGSHRIQRFSSRGVWLGTIDASALGAPASSNAPTGMTTNGRGQLFVVDYNLNRVQRFDYLPPPPPLTALGVLAAQAVPVTNDNFWFADHVASDDQGGAYVMDSQLTVYRLDAHGEVLNIWHASPDGAYAGFQPTSGITFHAGRVYVTDPIHGKVRVFERDGTFVEAWGSFPLTVPGGTWYLSGIQIDANGLVSVESSAQVARFHLNGDAVDSYGLPSGFFYYDGRLEVAPNGDGWIPTAQGKLLHLSEGGALLSQFPSLFGSSGDGASLYYSPGRGLYELDRDQAVLRLFDDSGGLLATQVLASPGVVSVWSIDGDANGSFWITEIARNARRYEVAPVLESIDDVPADAGRTVTLRFLRSSADAATSGSPVTEYEVFRKLDGVIPPDANPSPELPGWELVQTIPATRSAEYSLTTTTRSDATPAGRYLTTFLVRTRLAIGSVLDSQPIAGYSHDEIAPDPPTQVSVVESGGNATLHWRPGAQAGTRYRIHRDASPAFEVHEGNTIAETSDTTFSDPGVTGATYAIEAMDDAQNLSAAVTVSALGVLGVPPTAGASFALRRLVPNPSDGARLAVDLSLANAEPARLEVFDTSGRRVHDQALAGLGAGPHAVEIQPARRLAAGVYVVRLSTPRQSRQLRMLVVR